MARKFNFGNRSYLDGYVDAIVGKDLMIIEDQCTKLDTAQWTSTDDSGTGTNAVLDSAGGGISVVTAASDNDYHTMGTAGEHFKFQTGKITYAYGRVSLTEANTDDANIIFGFTDTLTTGGLVVDGGGPLASYDGAVFFKVDGGTVWQAEYSDAGTQTTDSNVGAFTSGSTYDLEIYFDGATTVYFYLDGVEVHKATVIPANLAEMHLVYGVVAGAGNAETLKVYRVIGIQEL